MKYIVFIATFLIVFSGLSEEFFVTTSGLNLRNSNSVNSEILSVLDKGDTVKFIQSVDTWSKVEFKNKIGYLSSQFLTKIDIKEQKVKELTFKDQKGFVNGFKYVFKQTFLTVFVLLLIVIAYFSRKKDARFKVGYREMKITNSFLLKLALFSSLVALLIGFFGGVISIFH